MIAINAILREDWHKLTDEEKTAYKPTNNSTTSLEPTSAAAPTLELPSLPASSPITSTDATPTQSASTTAAPSVPDTSVAPSTPVSPPPPAAQTTTATPTSNPPHYIYKVRSRNAQLVVECFLIQYHWKNIRNLLMDFHSHLLEQLSKNKPNEQHRFYIGSKLSLYFGHADPWEEEMRFLNL